MLQAIDLPHPLLRRPADRQCRFCVLFDLRSVDQDCELQIAGNRNCRHEILHALDEHDAFIHVLDVLYVGSAHGPTVSPTIKLPVVSCHGATTCESLNYVERQSAAAVLLGLLAALLAVLGHIVRNRNPPT